MTTTCLHVGRAFTPSGEIQDAGIIFRDGVIAQVAPRENLVFPSGAQQVAAKDRTAVPGFIDVHIHGAGGHDVMEGTDEALRKIAATIGSRGTTSFVATTVTADPDAIVHSSEGIANYVTAQHKETFAGAEVLGIHFEGPFINPVRRGVHPPEWLRLPTAELLGKFVSASKGNARILTIAPELLGAMPCIDAARKAGMVVGIGHTDATYEQTRAAVARGAHHAIHTYNAMRPFSHRDAGVIGAVLTSPDITAELIADGVHVDEIAMRMLLQAKGANGVILISDGISATGMPDGTYVLGGFEVTVNGGICRNAEGRLAGSTLTLDRALRNIVNLGAPLHDALQMLTLNPAKLLGIEHKKGVLKANADADILLLDEGLHVTQVYTRGLPL
ncbi:MAG TPA: N-acetylglucosamine-6-phosphate deacetylase [Candidatus Saccharimonadales bacterium]|nr:N-acetylglucosamine-6-phosphate deacetylase [Candidatus Saccharimonadales bacterium]